MVFAVILLFLLWNKFTEDKMQAYVYSVLAWTLYMFGLTEILSVFHQITGLNLWLAWGVFDVLLLAGCVKKHVFAKKEMKRNAISKGTVGVVLLYVISVSFLAVKTMPYNWDSMTYHLSRIVHWHQNQSIGHYATNINRQVASPVLGSFINLNIYTMLNENDRLLNLVQCFSYFTSGLLVYSIACKLGCGKKYCVMAGALFLSMPIAFGEALTTQTDNISAMYALGVIYLLLGFCDVKEKLVYNRYSALQVIMLGFCVSFAYLAKPSVGIGILFFAIWLLIVSIIRKDSIVIVMKLIITAIPGIIMVVLPETWRNLSTFHAFSASNVSSGQLIGSFHERYLAVNFLKNFTSNMPSVWLYDSSAFIWKFVVRFAGWVDIDIDDAAITNNEAEFVVRDAQTYSHSSAVNPIILWLLIITVIVLIFMARKIEWKKLKSMKAGYYLASVIGFLVFCTILKWSPWRNRYMIFYLALLSPAIVCVIEWFMRNIKQEKIELAFGAIVWFCMLTEIFGLFIYHNEKAFEKGKEERYFLSRTEEYAPYREAADYLAENDLKEIGLLLGSDTYEYPIWKMADADRIEHINVANETQIYEDKEFIPEVILVIHESVGENTLKCHGKKYELVKTINEDVQIYERMEQ